ncbi:hypothetical protein ACFL9T_14665 [Thermodesulfobacteriota bacterium]
MFKKLIPFFISLGLLFSVVYAEDSYTISGDVTFQYDGDIYVCLFTSEEFRDFYVAKYELSSSQCKVIRMNADLKRAGKVSFKFEEKKKEPIALLFIRM